jgi:hypothetical protein
LHFILLKLKNRLGGGELILIDLIIYARKAPPRVVDVNQ